MALNFFRQRDIERMNANDIPEEFINYFDTLDDSSKAALIGSRYDLAKALGFVLPDESGNVASSGNISGDVELGESNKPTELGEGANAVELVESVEVKTEEPDTLAYKDELEKIRHNSYEGKELDSFLRDNMMNLEALAISDEAKICPVHRKPLKKKQIKYKNFANKPTYGIVLRICNECHRVYIEESKMLTIDKALFVRGIPHRFYDLDITNKYLRSQMPPYEFSADDTLYIPGTWVEEDPRCPIHEEELYEIPCFKKYKDREIRFTGFRCDRCDKILMRRSSARDLFDKCAEKGIPQIKTEKLVKKAVKKQLSAKEIRSDYLIRNGKKQEFKSDVTSSCIELSEDDTVIVSDSIYCTISGHDDTEEVVALIWVLQKRGGRKAYLFQLGYCPDCQKYYMALEDYKVLYAIGRPEVTILLDTDDTDYQITSGEVFNLERNHLDNVEKQITDEVTQIKDSSDYVNPYATGDYDDGNLALAKYVSKYKYGERLDELSAISTKPYSYRVDISLDGISESYYIGASDVFLNGKQQVISANSDFGHELINYRTIKVQKDGKDYNIKLSRQFEIDNASLYGYINLRTDEDIVFKSGITDPFLVRVLNMRKKQHNLTDIFVTIQENQNRIVNSPFTKNIIVQGCAGSGKTMVLLHRLSSLNYKERYFDFPQNALILTPNDQFTLHIKGIAEELQIGGIQRISVEQYYTNILERYSPEFKLDRKVVSEMNVRQKFVDYVYSDRFLTDFSAAYQEIINKRNSMVVVLSNLLKSMEQPERNIVLSDDSRVIDQITNVVSAMQDIVDRRESEVNAATEEYQHIIVRKLYLQKKKQDIGEDFVADSLSRVHKRVGTYLSERQYKITVLEEQIKTLSIERDAVQRRLNPFGKQGRLNTLDVQIRNAEQSLDAERKLQEDELAVFSQFSKEFSEDEKLAWMRQVMLIIPEVRDEVNHCNELREEKQDVTKELSGIDTLIEEANKKVDEMKNHRYSDDVKKAISYLNAELDNYSVANTYQLVFDSAVAKFRNENDISFIQGKYHRYDLYARIIFAMRYFGKAIGTTQFMCIDEGQDLALNEYRLLYELNQYRVVFNIYGDTNQLIKPGRGISNWSELQKIFKAETYELNENYRNTNQITRFCNRSFGMKVTQTGVDGASVREIARNELEEELSALRITTERVAILVPRGVQKHRYLKKEKLSLAMQNTIGDKIDNGLIALMYVDEVKGIEFDKAYVVVNRMSRNEKYIAYTRALSELVLVVDDRVDEYDDGAFQNTMDDTE